MFNNEIKFTMIAALLVTGVLQAGFHPSADYSVTQVLDTNLGDCSPGAPNGFEDAAVGPDGRLYMSSYQDFAEPLEGRIFTYDENGECELFATIPGVTTVGGLEFDPSSSDIYVIANDESGGNPAAAGVYKIDAFGQTTKFWPTPNSPQIPFGFLNGIAVDNQANVFVTDSFNGAVLRISQPDENGYQDAEVWVQDAKLAPIAPGFIGANGIAIDKRRRANTNASVRNRNVYVSNSTKQLIVRIPIDKSGEAGDIEVITDSLPSFPDNLELSQSDRYLLAASQLAFGNEPIGIGPGARVFAIDLNKSDRCNELIQGSGLETTPTVVTGEGFGSTGLFRDVLFILDFRILGLNQEPVVLPGFTGKGGLYEAVPLNKSRVSREPEC